MALDKKIRYEIIVDTTNGKVQIDGITKGFEDAEKAVIKLNSTLRANETQLKKTRGASSGLAGAFATELGRGISDVQFGMVALQNNIVQMADLFGALTVAAGGFANAMRAVWTAIMGPAGIIIVFTTLLSVITAVMSRKQEAGEKVHWLKKAFAELGFVIVQTIKPFADFTAELFGFKDILALVKRQWKIFITTLLAGAGAIQGIKQTMQDLSKQIIGLIQSFLSLAKIDFSNGIKGFTKSILVNTVSLKKVVEDAGKLLSETPSTLKDNIKNSTNDVLAAYKNMLKKLEEPPKPKSRDLLQKLPIFDPDNWKKAAGRILKLLDEIFGRDGNIENQLKQSNFARAVFEAFAEDARIQEELLKQSADNVLAHYKRQYEGIMMITDAIGQALRDFNAVANAESDRQLAIAEANRDRVMNSVTATEEEKIKAEQKYIQERNKIKQKEAKMELKFAKLKMIAQAAQLMAQIQMDFAAGLTSVKTGAANTAKLGFPKAIPFLVSYAAAAAGIVAQMIAAKKKAQATIAEFSGGAVGGSGGASAGATFTPNFNVVGGTGVNQLRDAIEESLDRPTKVYVVPSDVRSAESMERNAVDSSSL